MDLVHAREDMEPPGALVQLAGRLRPAQHEDAQHGDLVAGEAERLVEELGGTWQRGSPHRWRGVSSRAWASRWSASWISPSSYAATIGSRSCWSGCRRAANALSQSGYWLGCRPLLLEQAAEDWQLDGSASTCAAYAGHVPVNVPFRETAYRVAKGLLAGRYPGLCPTRRTPRDGWRASRLGRATFYVDLTHPAGRLSSRTTHVTRTGCQAGRTPHRRLRHRRRPPESPGSSTTSTPLSTPAGGVYVHCLGGIGRTGTVVGVLARDALRARRRRSDRAHRRTPAGMCPTPSSPLPRRCSERSMVNAWSVVAERAVDVGCSAWRRHSDWHGESHWRCVAG